MVGRDDQQVAGGQPLYHSAQLAIQPLQCARIAGDVASVAVFLVEIDQVGEHQRPVRRRLQRVGRRLHQGLEAAGLDALRDPTAREDVGHLAHPDHGTARFGQAV